MDDGDDDDFFAMDQLVAAHQAKKVLVVDLVPPIDPQKSGDPSPPPSRGPAVLKREAIPSIACCALPGSVTKCSTDIWLIQLTHRRLCSPRLRLSAAMLPATVRRLYKTAGNSSGRDGKASRRRRQVALVAATAPAGIRAATSGAAGFAWGR